MIALYTVISKYNYPYCNDVLLYNAIYSMFKYVKLRDPQ